MIPVCVIAFGIRPLLGAGLTAIGAVVAMLFAGRDGRRQETELIQLSFTPAPQEPNHPDQLWIGACAVVAAFWMLSLYLVVRDIVWPTVGPDEMILRWMARMILVILSAGGMALYSQRPKAMAAKSDRN